MQSFKVLLNISQSASTSNGIVSGSSLQFEDRYYVNDQAGLNQGIVTEFNVNQFLDNPLNSGVTNAFMVYLTGNTTQAEQIEILNSDKKLANTFTNYYNTTIIDNLPSPTSYIDNNLTGTTAITVTNYDYYMPDADPIFGPLGTPVTIVPPKNRIDTNKQYLDTFTTEESFYLPVKINRSLVDAATVNFSEYSRDKLTEINGQTVLLGQGFVDINENFDEDDFWSDNSLLSRIPPIPSVPVPELPEPSSSDCTVFVTQAFEPEIWSCTITTELISTSSELYEETFEAPVDMSGVSEEGDFRDTIVCTLIDPGQDQLTDETCTGPCNAPNIDDSYSNWRDGDFFDFEYDTSSYSDEDYYDFYLTTNQRVVDPNLGTFEEDLYLAGRSVTGDTETIDNVDYYIKGLIRVNYNGSLSNTPVLIQKQPYSVNFLNPTEYQSWFGYGQNQIDDAWAGVSNLNGQPTVYVSGIYPSESELLGALQYQGNYFGETLDSTTLEEFAHNYDAEDVGFSTPVLYQYLDESLTGEVTVSVNYTYNKYTTNNNGVQDKYYLLAGSSPSNMRVVFRKVIDVIYTDENNLYDQDQIGRYSVIPQSPAYRIQEYIDDNVVTFNDGDTVFGIMVVGQSNSIELDLSLDNSGSEVIIIDPETGEPAQVVIDPETGEQILVPIEDTNTGNENNNEDIVITARANNVPKQFSIKSIQANCSR